MRRILVSQRVDIHPDYGERRDALDQKWSELLWSLGFVCVPVPNHADIAMDMLNLPFDGIILSGGNSPVLYGGTAPERDAVDELLIRHAVSNGVSLLGVCRGMQSLILHFGGTLKIVDGHISVRHSLSSGRVVNSFHAYSPESLPDSLITLEHSESGEIESIKHKSLSLHGIMWHPERETPFDSIDIEMIKSIFGGQEL